MEDSVFGTLEFIPGQWADGSDAHWEKSEWSELTNATIPLQIYADTNGPTEE